DVRIVEDHEIPVSIHAPAGGATRQDVAENDLFGVSIHAPAGGATHKGRLYRFRGRFNPRARGGRDGGHGAPACPDSGFNPRARGGRDLIYIEIYTNKLVSIHAPAGGATATGRQGAGRDRVSIHAPAGGATI